MEELLTVCSYPVRRKQYDRLSQQQLSFVYLLQGVIWPQRRQTPCALFLTRFSSLYKRRDIFRRSLTQGRHSFADDRDETL